jgi:PAS domain S-box-containing protein
MSPRRPPVGRAVRATLLAAVAIVVSASTLEVSAAQEPADPIIVSQDHSWPPLSFMDAGGEPQGILIDLWREIGRMLDRPVEFRLTDWNESIEQVVRGDAMVHGGLFESEERRRILTFTEDLLPLSAVLYARAETAVLAVDELGDRPVGIIEGSFELEHVRSRYPGLNLVFYANNDEMVRAAAAGYVDAFAIDYPVGLYLLDRYAQPGDFNVLTPLYRQMLRAAVRPGDQALLAQVNGALAALSNDEVRRITQRWTSTERVERVPPWFYPVLVAGGAGVIVLLLSLYTWNLRTRRVDLEHLVRQRTEAIQRQEARLANIIEGGDLGTWEWNLETGEVTINDRWAEMLGYRRDEIEPVTFEWWASRVHPEDLAACEEAIRGHRNGEAPSYSAEFRMRHRSGEWVWIHTSGRLLSPIRGSGEVFMYGCHVDIHQRRALELQIERAQRMEGIGTLAGGIAHDLNNVLTPILMSMELLKDEGLAASERRAIIESVEEGARRGADIVGQVLAYARGAEGRRSPLCVEPLLDALRRMMRETLPRSIELTFEVEPELPAVMADATQLHQILLNLLVNARDALPDGGAIEVGASSVHLGGGDVGQSPDLRPGRHLRLTVRDSGTGIPEAAVTKIFEPFYTTKEPGKGTGLGLSTSLSLTRANEGALHVESREGEGTCFVLHFPALDAEVESGVGGSAEPAGSDPAGSEPAGSDPAGSEPAGSDPAGSKPAGSEPGGSKPGDRGVAGRDVPDRDVPDPDVPDLRIPDIAPYPGPGTVLVVDDEEGIRRVVERALSRSGYVVLLSRDGREGLDLFERHRDDIEVVLTDIMMPVMSGTQLIAAIRERDPAVRIIAMSGLVRDEKLQSDLEHVEMSFLPKPFDVEMLLEVVAGRPVR